MQLLILEAEERWADTGEKRSCSGSSSSSGGGGGGGSSDGSSSCSSSSSSIDNCTVTQSTAL